MTKLEERTGTGKLIGSFWAKCDSDKFQPAYEHVFREGKTLFTISICFGLFSTLPFPFLINKTIKLGLPFRSVNNKVSKNFFILIGLLSSCKTHLSPKNNPDWQKVVCCLKIPLFVKFHQKHNKIRTRPFFQLLFFQNYIFFYILFFQKSHCSHFLAYTC